MAKPSAFAKMVQAEVKKKLADERHVARVFQMDLVTLALGRMGWREKRLAQLDEMLVKVANDIGDEIEADLPFDPDIWATKDKLDRELAQYAGKMFVPYKERYK